MLRSYRVRLSGSFAVSVPDEQRDAALQHLSQAPSAVLAHAEPSTFTVHLHLRADSPNAALERGMESLVSAVHAAWLTIDDVAVASAEASEEVVD